VRRAAENQRIVIAGSSYAGLHVALRLATKLRDNPGVELTLVDRHDYHQTLTELPQVGAGTHAADAVRIPPQRVMRERVGFVETEVTASTWPLGRCRPRTARSTHPAGAGPGHPAQRLHAQRVRVAGVLSRSALF
jgi:hypothetical protein